MSQIGGETIQLSFGPSANAVTSHLCNLYGLACTSSETDDAIYQQDQNDSSNPLCDPYITHAVQNETYVPRVLFVDGRNCFEYHQNHPEANAYPNQNQNKTNAGDYAHAHTGTGTNEQRAGAHSSTWSGAVEVHHRAQIQIQSSYNSNDEDPETRNAQAVSYADSSYASSSSNWNQLQTSQRHAFSQFQNVASVISNRNHDSRYHSSRYSNVSSRYVYPKNLSSDDGRVMNWDDEEEEEIDEYGRGDDDHLDENSKERKRQLELEKLSREEEEMGQQLHQAWEAFVGVASSTNHDTARTSSNASTNANTTQSPSLSQQNEQAHDKRMKQEEKSALEASSKRKMALDALQWMNYFMPPHPSLSSFSAPLPFDSQIISHEQKMPEQKQQQQQQQQSMIDSFQCGKYPSSMSASTFTSPNSLSQGMTNEWREEVLSDKIRKWMEDCDAVRGFQIMVDHGDKDFFAGLACSVLEELGDECRSAGKLSIMVDGGGKNSFFSSPSDSSEDDTDSSARGNKKHMPYWRSENEAVKAFRSGLNDGLALHGISENSDLVLPLSLPKCWRALRGDDHHGRNLFEASAAGAMALENVTLPYRLAKGGSASSSASARSKIGIGSGYFQGSSQGDDDAYPTADKLSYHEFISSMKPSNRHIVTELSGLVRPVPPGQVHQSLLQGTSIERRQMEEERNRNRNSYYRRSRGRDIDPGLWMEDEGPNGGIVSSLSPVDESNSSRTLHSHYALASSLRPLPSRVGDVISTYTTSLMEGMAIRYRPQCSVATVVGQSFDGLTGSRGHSAGSYWSNILGPQSRTAQTLTILGNTTRIHSHLQNTAKDFKSALSRKYAGYLSRDGMSGLAPESEDCSDAMEACMYLRDVYEPPSMGFDSDDEGVYFDDNED